jgi:hypothetical protein
MKTRIRRIVGVLFLLCSIGFAIYQSQQPVLNNHTAPTTLPIATSGSALAALDTLAVKGRAPKTGYTRAEFGDGWAMTGLCDTRNIILHRDLQSPVENDQCQVVKGTLNDPYSGTVIEFQRGATTSADVQIDHVVALSNAWQTGAQYFTADQRIALANDPLELLAVSAQQNEQKSDGDAATWLPANKPFRCQYVARQIAVKAKYSLWVTSAERDAIRAVLSTCPDQQLPVATLSSAT